MSRRLETGNRPPERVTSTDNNEGLGKGSRRPVMVDFNLAGFTPAEDKTIDINGVPWNPAKDIIAG